jgi:hypothetical protein
LYLCHLLSMHKALSVFAGLAVVGQSQDIAVSEKLLKFHLKPSLG